MPALPIVDEATTRDEEIMPSIRRVIEYSGLNYYEALNLPCDTFMLMSKNAYVDEMSKTEAGRAYLEKCARMKITEPDMGAIRAFQRERGL